MNNRKTLHDIHFPFEMVSRKRDKCKKWVGKDIKKGTCLGTNYKKKISKYLVTELKSVQKIQ